MFCVVSSRGLEFVFHCHFIHTMRHVPSPTIYIRKRYIYLLLCFSFQSIIHIATHNTRRLLDERERELRLELEFLSSIKRPILTYGTERERERERERDPPLPMICSHHYNLLEYFRILLCVTCDEIILKLH